MATARICVRDGSMAIGDVVHVREFPASLRSDPGGLMANCTGTVNDIALDRVRVEVVALIGEELHRAWFAPGELDIVSAKP